MGMDINLCVCRVCGCIMTGGVESEKKVLSNKLGFVRVWKYKYIQE